MKISKNELYDLIVSKTTKLIGRKRSYEEMYNIAIDNDLHVYDSRIPVRSIEIEENKNDHEWFELIKLIKKNDKDVNERFLSCLSVSELLDICTKNNLISSW